MLFRRYSLRPRPQSPFRKDQIWRVWSFLYPDKSRDFRSADFFFRDLVVPELGRIWFVRQLSWPLASLALHESFQSQGSNAPKPTAICHGIEALACKLEYHVDPQGRNARCRVLLRTF